MALEDYLDVEEMAQDDYYAYVNVKRIIRESASGKAILCEMEDDNDNRQEWFPYSQIKKGEEVYPGLGTCTLVIPRWLLKEKNLEEAE